MKINHDKEEKHFPTMEEILQLHEDGHTYLMFVKEFIRIVQKKACKNN
jgi:hypothetical protein